MSLQDLDPEHAIPLRLALSNLLSTPVAEFTYAQIVDGMPVSDVYAEDHFFREEWPVMQHEELCPGSLEKTRAFRSEFDYLALSLDAKAIQAYQNTVPGSLPWKLRLLELLSMSCHDIAISLYSLDGGVHKHADWTSWRELQLQKLPENCSKLERGRCGPPTLFYAGPYLAAERFPHGLADVAGYWAELRIFGGVVLFDRGESEDECNGMYLHRTAPSTLAPPTEHQFNSLLDFLLSSEPDLASCPLPITVSKDNRWRWRPYEAMTEYNFFKYRCDLSIQDQDWYLDHRPRASFWPERTDYEAYEFELWKKENGEPYDEDLLKVSWDRLVTTMTPSSKYWDKFEAEIIRIQPCKKKQGRPPYFFDA